MLDRSDSLFVAVDSPLHRRWRRDRSILEDIPAQHRLRGCVGLAAMVAEGVELLNIGNMMLLPNQAITWMAMRDLPPGCFPASCTLNGHTVRYVSSTMASLRFGVPTIGLDTPNRDAFDFAIEPYGSMYCLADDGLVEEMPAAGDILNSSRRSREFALGIALTNWMTRAAGYGMDRDGRPINPAWHENRPDDGRCFRVPSPSAWMPQAYLAFPLHLHRWLFHLATESPQQSWRLWCPQCRRWIALEEVQGYEAREDDAFTACCPRCRRRQRWNLESAVPAVCPRFFSPAFRSGFCRDLAQGLPLAVGEDCTYLGIAKGHTGGPDLIGHHFRAAIDSRDWCVYLPADASILVSSGASLKTRDIWCRVLAFEPGERWLREDPRNRWARLADVCGTAAMACLLQKLWLDNQVIRLPGHPDQILVPADLAGSACRHVGPAALWWDVSLGLRHWNEECRAFVYPPIPLRHWDDLRMMLPGEVQLCAGIGDPRFVLPQAPVSETLPASTSDAEFDDSSAAGEPAVTCAA